MKKILFIEDDDILQRMYTKKLTSQQFDILQARDGTTALALLKNTIPDLILLDIMLPGHINGFDILENIKKSPTLKNIPVIILTNLDSEEKTAKEIGANAYFVKANTKTDDLVASINKLLA